MVVVGNGFSYDGRQRKQRPVSSQHERHPPIAHRGRSCSVKSARFQDKRGDGFYCRPVGSWPQEPDKDVTLGSVRPIRIMEDKRLDRTLLVVARADPEAFAEFYRRHVDRIVAFAAARVRSPEEVADLVASTFLVALDHAGNYDPARGEPIRWLYGIASNLLANQRRRRVRESLAHARFDARSLLEESDIERLESQIHAASTASLVQRAIQDLPERQREILLLVGADELGSSAGGAEILRITPIAFRVRLARARRALRSAMERSASGAAVDPGEATD